MALRGVAPITSSEVVGGLGAGRTQRFLLSACGSSECKRSKPAYASSCTCIFFPQAIQSTCILIEETVIDANTTITQVPKSRKVQLAASDRIKTSTVHCSATGRMLKNGSGLGNVSHGREPCVGVSVQADRSGVVQARCQRKGASAQRGVCRPLAHAPLGRRTWCCGEDRVHSPPYRTIGLRTVRTDT